MEGGAALRAGKFRCLTARGRARYARMGVCNPASDQRERRFANRAVARNGIQRPNVGPALMEGGRRFAPENFAAWRREKLQAIPYPYLVRVIFARHSATYRASSSVFCFPKEIRIVPRARLSGAPIAFRT